MTPEQLNAWRIIPRILMFAMIAMTYRTVEWFMSFARPNPEQAALVSVMTGAPYWCVWSIFGQKRIMADLNVQLLPWQQEVYSDPTRFKVVAAGRRTSKSRLAAWLLIINGLQADKGHVFYVAQRRGKHEILCGKPLWS